MSVCKFIMVDKLTGRKRLVVGLLVLLLVDFIWVGSSELTEYLFKQYDYDKPYFTTYMKTAMFVLYLVGFLFKRSWRQQCRWSNSKRYNIQDPNCSPNLSEPVYVPIRNEDDGYSSIDSSDGLEPIPQTSLAPARKTVRFSDQTEVRCLNGDAEEANLARLSYEHFIRKQAERARLRNKFPVPIVCKLALLFCVLWFVATFSYQEALKDTEAAIVNVISSCSGLFTLVFAAIWSSGPSDRFTFSKFLAVLVSLGGAIMVAFSDASLEMKFPSGTIWALVGALAYALYLVTLKRRVKDDSMLNIPMFFGFVGLFNLVILWPGLLIFHYTNWETFRLPTWQQLLIILANGLVGTVLSEFLWLWGCFLTSSLVGTLALGLVTPLSMLFDVLIKKVSYNWMFYTGIAPMLLSFVAVTAFSHYDNWDPAWLLIKKCTKGLSRALQSAKMREMDSDQTERLLGRDAE